MIGLYSGHPIKLWVEVVNHARADGFLHVFGLIDRD